MHQIIDGKKVECSPEEEQAIIAQWEKNKIKIQERRLQKEKEITDYENALDKILVSLSEEEKAILKKTLIRLR